MGKATFTPNQTNFRFYGDGTEDGSSPIAAETVDITRDANSSDVNFHLRILIQEVGGATGATTDDYQLQYSLNGGAYTNITTTSSVVKGFNSASLTDADVTTNRATNGITDGSGSFVAGEISETGLVTDRELTTSNFTEMLYSLTLVSADLVYGDSINFRTLINGGTMIYTVTPNIVVASSTATYYFDGSDAAASDPNNAWTNETNIDDGNTGTFAQTTTNGSNSSNYIQIEGTNAPSSGDNISLVKARVYSTDSDGADVSSLTTITAPGGSWDWSKIQSLETRIWFHFDIFAGISRGEYEIYADGDSGGTPIASATDVDAVGGQLAVSMIEFIVYLGATSGGASIQTPTKTLLSVGI